MMLLADLAGLWPGAAVAGRGPDRSTKRVPAQPSGGFYCG